MKKVLYTTTALVASAGIMSAADIASAQGVVLTGTAEMGVIGGNDTKTQFHHDIDITFTLSGETDSGLTFGATIDLDDLDDDCTKATKTVKVINPKNVVAANATTDPVTEANDGANGNTGDVEFCDGGNGISNKFGEHTVWLTSPLGTVTMGDTDGAFDWALTEVNIGSALNDDHTGHPGFSGNSGLDGTHDGQVASYAYSFGDFGFAVSAEIADADGADYGSVLGVGAKYTGDLGGLTLGVGLGYQAANGNDKHDDKSVTGVSLTAAMENGLEARLNYSSFNNVTMKSSEKEDMKVDNHMAIGVGYTMDALTVSANYGVYDTKEEKKEANFQGFGLAANYDLGGGAVAQFGYGSGKKPNKGAEKRVVGDTASVNTWSMGVAMKF